MRQLISRFLNDESGATAIEYCLIAVGLSIVIITAVNGIGSTLNGKFTLDQYVAEVTALRSIRLFSPVPNCARAFSQLEPWFRSWLPLWRRACR